MAIDRSDVVLRGMDVANRIKQTKVERKWRDLADADEWMRWVYMSFL